MLSVINSATQCNVMLPLNLFRSDDLKSIIRAGGALVDFEVAKNRISVTTRLCCARTSYFCEDLTMFKRRE
jgi:hypothetical protein